MQRVVRRRRLSRSTVAWLQLVEHRLRRLGSEFICVPNTCYIVIVPTMPTNASTLEAYIVYARRQETTECWRCTDFRRPEECCPVSECSRETLVPSPTKMRVAQYNFLWLCDWRATFPTAAVVQADIWLAKRCITLTHGERPLASTTSAPGYPRPQFKPTKLECNCLKQLRLQSSPAVQVQYAASKAWARTMVQY